MEEAGLDVRLDSIGNLIGRRAGTDPTRPVLVIGSHLDSVPQGGRFDGALGMVTALEIVRALNDLGITMRHTLEIVSFSDEEGGLLGSRGWIGTVTEADLDKRYGTRSLRDALRELGLDPDRVAEAQRAPSEIAAYLELHVEQGRFLEREGLQIGIVEGIVALDEYQIIVSGTANHAGTTRMADRDDPMTAAAQMITAVRREVLGLGDDLVATVGTISALPGAPNVIPSEVRFTIDIRDPSRLVLERAVSDLKQQFEAIARSEGVRVSWEPIVQIPSAPAHPAVLQALKEAVATYRFPNRVMPSGAGHDAQSIAKIAPMGMIFVPSVGGLSHTAAEFTRFEDAAAGADVILQAILLLDQRLP
jgi:N-carbamoyl-L-amino-acid hydrolase